MKISNAMCSYLRAIVQLQKQKDEVHNIDIALYLGFSKASVSKALHILEKEGLIYRFERKVYVCESGELLAQNTQNHYEVMYAHLLKKGFSVFDANHYTQVIMQGLDDDFFKVYYESTKP